VTEITCFVPFPLLQFFPFLFCAFSSATSPSLFPLPDAERLPYSPPVRQWVGGAFIFKLAVSYITQALPPIHAFCRASLPSLLLAGSRLHAFSSLLWSPQSLRAYIPAVSMKGSQCNDACVR
jgi:hypothetical protein